MTLVLWKIWNRWSPKTLQSCAAQNGITGNGKTGYKFLFPLFPYVLQYGLCTWFYNHQNYQFSRFRTPMGHYMRKAVRKWVYIAQNLCSLFKTTNKNSTDSIALLFLCFHTCCPLKLRHLSYLGTSFSVPCWRKPIPHSCLQRCGRHDFALALQTDCKFRRRFKAVCATFQDLCCSEIIRHLNLYTLTHNSYVYWWTGCTLL